MESISGNLDSTDDLVPSFQQVFTIEPNNSDRLQLMSLSSFQLSDGFSNDLLDNLIDTASTKPLTWL